MSEDQEIQNLIALLSEAPDGQLAEPLATRCQAYLDGQDTFSGDGPLFLSDLRDEAIHTGGASGFVMHMFKTLLDDLDVGERLERHEDAFRNRKDSLT